MEHTLACFEFRKRFSLSSFPSIAFAQQFCYPLLRNDLLYEEAPYAAG